MSEDVPISATTSFAGGDVKPRSLDSGDENADEVKDLHGSDRGLAEATQSWQEDVSQCDETCNGKIKTDTGY